MVTHEEILDAIKARDTWERRQEVYYRMRHDGLRRASKPWKNAADMHFPLGDMTIEKLKPFYVNQLYAADTFASFYSLAPELVAHQQLAAQWFDWILRTRSNFEEAMVQAVDIMLQNGRVPVEVRWDPETRRIVFDAAQPTHVIVPPWTKKIEDADWIVHVQQFSKGAYQRRSDFDQTILKEILGGETETTEETTKKLREGITFSRNKDVAIVWEKFERTETGWTVSTYSPSKPNKPVRPDFVLPYSKGVFEALKCPPWGSLPCEEKDPGYYAPRGVMERVAPFEQSLNHDWNTIKDYQTLTCAPIFSAPGAPPNTSNVRFRPGDVLGYALEAVTFPPIPMDLRQGMMDTRMTAEQAVAMPDFGSQQPQQGSKPRTAREVSLVANVMGQSVDLRGRIFRRAVAHLLNLAWALALQYLGEELQYVAAEQIGALPKQALDSRYQIELAGSPEIFSRAARLQQAQARFQMFRGAPNIDQDELTKSVLEVDDPRLVRRLFRPAQNAAASQAERQAQEIATMMLGFPAQLRPDDDHPAHLQAMLAFAQRLRSAPMPVAQDSVQLLAQHAQEHLAALAQTNPQAAQQFAGQIQALMGAGQPQPQPMPQ